MIHDFRLWRRQAFFIAINSCINILSVKLDHFIKGDLYHLFLIVFTLVIIKQSQYSRLLALQLYVFRKKYCNLKDNQRNPKWLFHIERRVRKLFVVYREFLIIFKNLLKLSSFTTFIVIQYLQKTLKKPKKMDFALFQIINNPNAFSQSVIAHYDFYSNVVKEFHELQCEKNVLTTENTLRQTSSKPKMLLSLSNICEYSQPSNTSQKEQARPSREDQEYKPQKKPRYEKKLVTRQKQQRNLIPNTVHHLLVFIQKKIKSGYLAERLLRETNKNPNYSLVRFYNFHKMLRTKINNYVNQDSIKLVTQPGTLSFDVFGKDQQEYYCYISRVMIKKFLKMEAILMILNSSKVRKQNRIEHLSVQRFIYENLTVQGLF